MNDAMTPTTAKELLAQAAKDQLGVVIDPKAGDFDLELLDAILGVDSPEELAALERQLDESGVLGDSLKEPTAKPAKIGGWDKIVRLPARDAQEEAFLAKLHRDTPTESEGMSLFREITKKVGGYFSRGYEATPAAVTMRDQEDAGGVLEVSAVKSPREGFHAVGVGRAFGSIVMFVDGQRVELDSLTTTRLVDEATLVNLRAQRRLHSFVEKDGMLFFIDSGPVVRSKSAVGSRAKSFKVLKINSRLSNPDRFVTSLHSTVVGASRFPAKK